MDLVGETQHEAFAVGEGIGRGVPGRLGEVRRDRAPACRHGAHGCGEHVGRRVLQEIPRRAGLHRASQISGPRERRDDHDAGRKLVRGDALAKIEAAEPWHLHVREQNVRRQRAHEFEGRRAILRLAELIAALNAAPELGALILAIGMSIHWPVIGWSYGRTALFTAHAVVRAILVLAVWIWAPEMRLTLLPATVAAVYLVTVLAILIDSARLRAKDRAAA